MIGTSPRIRAIRGALEKIAGTTIDNSIVLRDNEGHAVRVSVGEDGVHVRGGGPEPIVARVVSLGRLFCISVFVDEKTVLDASEPVTAHIIDAQPAVRAASPVPSVRRDDHEAFTRALERIPDLERVAPDTASIAIGGVTGELRASYRSLTLRFPDLPRESTRQALALFLAQVMRCADLAIAWFRVSFAEQPPTWVHLTLRNLEFTPEQGAASYIRRPRPER
jgi:hypothetical protein